MNKFYIKLNIGVDLSNRSNERHSVFRPEGGWVLTLVGVLRCGVNEGPPLSPSAMCNDCKLSEMLPPRHESSTVV